MFGMPRRSKHLPIPPEARVLGDRAFAAIAAVEGLFLNLESSHRLASMQARKLSREEQRAEIIRAYAGSRHS
jgi:tryptophan synthase beta subunit